MQEQMLIIEAWKHDRAINRLIVADALKILVGIACVTVGGYAAHLAPGATSARLELFDAYHFYLIFGLSIYFTLFLVAEITVILIKRLKRISREDT